MPDEDVRTMVREFRASVSADLEAQHRRIDDLADEMRRRFATMETAIINEIRDMGGRLDRRIERGELRFDEIDVRLDGIDVRLDGIDGRLDGIDGRLDGIDVRLDGIDGRLDVITDQLGRG